MYTYVEDRFFEASHQLLWKVSHGNGRVERRMALLQLLLLWVMWMGSHPMATRHDTHNARRAVGRWYIDLPLG